MEVKIEYQGEAYELKPGKIYLLKMNKRTVQEEAAYQIVNLLKSKGIEVVLVGVDNMDDLQIMEDKNT